MLSVAANQEPVGSLNQEIGTRGPVHKFDYNVGVPASSAVSLLMPPRAEPYVMDGKLHPVFDMNLPEGELRLAIGRLFAKALPLFNDFTLLEVVGGSLIGRLRFGAAPAPAQAENIRDFLTYRGTADLFRDLLERYARNSGVSGVQPKLLIRDNGSLMTEQFSPLSPAERVTAQGTTHIVKTFDPEKYPGLAANEFLCLQAAQSAGIPTPDVHLADDGGLLAVRRFDLNPDGTYLAFEDACSLAGRVSSEKYEGSYEQLAGMFSKVLRSPDGQQAELRQLFKSIALSVVVRNGDAHRKNFGVLYADATKEIRLAPTFDVLTTDVYIRGDAMALTLDGKKSWPDAKRLLKFGVQRCQMAPKVAKEALDEVVEGVAATRAKIADTNIPADVATKIHESWDTGLTQIGTRESVVVALPTSKDTELIDRKPPTR